MAGERRAARRPCGSAAEERKEREWEGKEKRKKKNKKWGKKEGKERESRGGNFGDDHGGVGHARRSRACAEREIERGLESGVGKGSGELGLRGLGMI